MKALGRLGSFVFNFVIIFEEKPMVEIKTEGKRWLIAFMGAILMLCLGTVYAWSYFQTPIMKEYGWNNVEVSLIFSFAIFFLGVSAAIGGVWLPRLGPRKLALTGSLLFSLGYIVAAIALSTKSLPLLYIGYGVIGGSGLGLCYVTPVATVSKWFPDRKGLATGMIIMGFGLGALFMSKILAPALLSLTGNNLVVVFLCLGFLFFILTFVSSLFMRNPPVVSAAASSIASGNVIKAKKMIFSGKFVLIWLMFFCNITAGIAIVGFQSPLFQDVWKKVNPDLSPRTLAGYGATLIALTSLFNGFGRFAWASLSDRIGRMRTFRVLMGSELAVFIALIFMGNPWIVAILLCWILFCYGGGFGTMPSAILEAYGPTLMAAMYGAVLTAWSAAGVAGPQITAFIKDNYPNRASTLSFVVGAVFVAIGFVISLLIPHEPVKL